MKSEEGWIGNNTHIKRLGPMKQKLIDYKDFMREALLDKKYAQHYLDAALAEGDIEFFRECLLDVVKVQIGVQKLAGKLSIDRQTIYRALSKKGTLNVDRMHAILENIGFQLRVGISP